tara:strand:- start:5437 stop:6660 length:1224 start_codon:yes stop_codon:yes gene_type:complete
MKFSSFLTEQKNAHMEHIEDMIFNDGVDGARSAINSLRSLRDMLAGASDKAVNVTVKWDGAPAIFAGVDPSDGKFFVAKKGVFNVNPQLFKTEKEINSSLSGDLAAKFRVALREFSKLGITKGMYQGDLMFTRGDIKVKTIQGNKYYTFQPNTIVYVVPVNSALGRQIKSASIGIVWHTTYTGSTLQKMSASFGKDIVNKMKSPKSVWMDDATYRDVSGNATFTKEETNQVTELLSQAGKIFQTISGEALNTIRDDEELKQKIKTYNNTFVRANEPFPNPKAHVRGLYDYITDWYQKEIDKKKTEKTKEAWTAKRDEVLKKVFQNTTELTNIFTLMNVIIQAKASIIAKLNRASSLGTFLRTKKGFETTSQEGYVSIDRIGNAVKIVDRLEFSRANFSPEVIKGWQK